MYRNHYKGGHDFKILDNGVAEGLLANIDDLFDYAVQLGVHEIVVPDVLGDCDATIDAALDFKQHARTGYQYMGVAQGRSMAEVIKCAAALDGMGYMHTLGIPRVLNRVIHKTFRQTLLETILPREVLNFVDYHCLGTSEWTQEVKALADIGSPKLRGIDTSLPCVMGVAGKELGDNEYVGRSNDYFGTIPTGWQWECCWGNVRTFLEWAQAPSAS
jgi:hypothetical protein